MSIFPEGSLSGEYASTFSPSTDIPESAVVIVNSFGFRDGAGESKVPGPLNESLAQFTDEHFSHLPILVGKDVVPALESDPEMVLDVESTSGMAATLLHPRTAGTAGELLLSKSFMSNEGYTSAIIVAQAYHVPRVAAMANKMNIATEVPEGLTNEFDPLNAQPWIRSEKAWKNREIPTILFYTAMRMM